MAKASLSSKDASKGSFGLQEGNVEITAAVCKVHQYPPSKETGKQSDPFACVQLTFRKLDNDGDQLPDEQEEVMEFGIGKLEKFHPGLAKNAEDDDPKDAGDEVDVEGNCIYSVEGAAIHKNSKWMRLAESLEAAGFKSDVLGTGYLPELVGTKGYVKTIALPRIPGSTAKNDPTALVFDKITEFPYGKPKGKGKASGAGVGAGAGAGTAVAKASSKPVAATVDAEPDDEAAGHAAAAIRAVAKGMAGQEDVERKKFYNAVHTKVLTTKVPVKLHKPVMALVKGEWGQEFGGENALYVMDEDADTITFMEQ